MRLHPIPNSDYWRLREIINAISNKIGAMLLRNETFDERGLTDVLFDYLQTSFSHVKLSKYYIRLDAKKPSEKKTGADILFRIKINRQEINLDRYVLIQAKKYIASTGNFSETDRSNVHLTGQVAKMHKYNPEFSYIMLYSTTTKPLANIVAGFPYLYSNMYFDLDSSGLEYFQEYHPLSNLQHNYPITLLRSKTWEKFVNTEPDNLLSYSETFPNFLLDDLITGKIGIDWDSNIQNAQGEFSIIVTLAIGQG